MSVDPRRIAAQRLPLLPSRAAASGPRNGSQMGTAAQQAGDLFWRRAVEIFKPVYTRIDARFPLAKRQSDEEYRNAHQALLDEAKKILQEHRNQIFEVVLPHFTVKAREKDEEPTEADVHAHDYFIQNVFNQMVDTLIAQLDTFVDRHDVLTVEAVVSKLADVQRKRLASELLNFTFGFRKVVAPQKRQG